VVEFLVWRWATDRIFVARGLWLEMMAPAFTLGMSVALAGFYEGLRMFRVFGRLLPGEVAGRYALAGSGDAPATVEEEMTVVFSDVRNYAALSESLESAALERLLHTYFETGEEIANRYGASVDKFVGDSIMLYFRSRRGQEAHGIRAVRWALDMVEAAAGISESGAGGSIGFEIGIGICSGRVRIGSVGARQRIQHTLIGDAVNTASRLQDLTKQLGRPILMDESVYNGSQGRVEAEPLGEASVKGKQAPLSIYAPLRVKDGASMEDSE